MFLNPSKFGSKRENEPIGWGGGFGISFSQTSKVAKNKKTAARQVNVGANTSISLFRARLCVCIYSGILFSLPTFLPSYFFLSFSLEQD